MMDPTDWGWAGLSFATASVWEITHLELALRMILAVVLGGLIGIEREWSNHAAGFRTHILVCLGSATIMLLSSYGFSQFVNEGSVRMDPARLAAQVISGIGFLGAGAILRNGNMIKGLTTGCFSMGGGGHWIKCRSRLLYGSHALHLSRTDQLVSAQ